MRYYIMAPAGVESGGPELAHQLCYELNRNSVDAKMYYADEYQKEPIDIPAPEKYRKYQTCHEVDFARVDAEDAILVCNEGMTSYLPQFNKCKKILWWMSVDNYVNFTGEADLETVRSQVELHLAQSYYAYDYLKNHVKIAPEKIMFLSDYISEAYGQFILPEAYRQDIVLYNPKKGYADLKPLIESTQELQWIPLIHLTEEQMIILMQSAKVYIDFGSHPGKDRIPREAASCGCCVITNTKGSAAFEEDVPIEQEYKFTDVPGQYELIRQKLTDICRNYKEHSMHFEAYRRFIKEEKAQFERDVLEFINANQVGKWEG